MEALQERNRKLEAMVEDVKHMRRWAQGENVLIKPQQVLNAMARMCNDALADLEDDYEPNSDLGDIYPDDIVWPQGALEDGGE